MIDYDLLDVAMDDEFIVLFGFGFGSHRSNIIEIRKTASFELSKTIQFDGCSRAFHYSNGLIAAGDISNFNERMRHKPDLQYIKKKKYKFVFLGRIWDAKTGAWLRTVSLHSIIGYYAGLVSLR